MIELKNILEGVVNEVNKVNTITIKDGNTLKRFSFQYDDIEELNKLLSKEFSPVVADKIIKKIKKKELKSKDNEDKVNVEVKGDKIIIKEDSNFILNEYSIELDKNNVKVFGPNGKAMKVGEVTPRLKNEVHKIISIIRKKPYFNKIVSKFDTAKFDITSLADGTLKVQDENGNQLDIIKQL